MCPPWTTRLDPSRDRYVSRGRKFGMTHRPPARSLLWGVLLIHIFIGLRLVILIAYGMSLNESGATALPDSLWHKALASGILSVSVGQGPTYIVAVVIWASLALPAMLALTRGTDPVGGGLRGRLRGRQASAAAQ